MTSTGTKKYLTTDGCAYLPTPEEFFDCTIEHYNGGLVVKVPSEIQEEFKNLVIEYENLLTARDQLIELIKPLLDVQDLLAKRFGGTFDNKSVSFSLLGEVLKEIVIESEAQ